MAWLHANRIAATLSKAGTGAGAGAGIISVMGGVATIFPPYTPEACRSSNEIVLARVQDLVAALQLSTPAATGEKEV